jgi:DNA-binding MarR family transcriptional regulator
MDPPTADAPAAAADAQRLERERFLIHLIAVVEAARTSGLDPKLKAAGLTTPAIRALAWIQADPGGTMSDLAAGVFPDRTTLTRTVDTLVRDGFVIRAGAVDDRRKVTLTITPAGAELCRLGHAIIDQHNVVVAGLLDLDTLSTINRALLKLHRVFVPDDRIRNVHTGRA